MIFNKKELHQIKRAVEELESKFPLEVVPVFVEKSSTYYISRFRALVIGTVSSFLLMYSLNKFTVLEWYPLYGLLVFGLLWIVLILMLCEFVPAISRALAGNEYLKETTLLRAKEEYILQEVYSNPKRVGIMIFVSFYEHQFHIICDKKGATFFGEKEWDEVSKELVTYMKKDEPCKAIEHCISAIGKVIAEEVEETDDLPPSILSNDLRYED